MLQLQRLVSRHRQTQALFQARRTNGLNVSDLRADVDIDPDDSKFPQLRRFAVNA